ncbi:MAG: ATP-binding protein, partial [Pirellulales bacterium]|nr:ATP-binding protein [Pirellulales bacterium]
LPASRTHSEETAREIDEEVRRIVDTSIEAVRQILASRRAALETVTSRLMEAEVIDGEELRALVEASTGTPQLVPGTATDRRPARPQPKGEQPGAAAGGADS